MGHNGLNIRHARVSVCGKFTSQSYTIHRFMINQIARFKIKNSVVEGDRKVWEVIVGLLIFARNL